MNEQKDQLNHQPDDRGGEDVYKRQELLCAIGLFNYFNRFNNALNMEPTKPGEGGCAVPATDVYKRQG